MRKTGLMLVLLIFFLIKNVIAGDKMSLKFFDGKLKVGGDFYVRYETRSDYYTSDGKFIEDEGISSRQRLSFEIVPTNETSFTFTVLKCVDWTDPHPVLFPYTYDHEVDIQQAYIFFKKSV